MVQKDTGGILEYTGKIQKYFKKKYEPENKEVIIGSLIFALPPSMQSPSFARKYPPGTRVKIEHDGEYRIKTLIDAEVQIEYVQAPMQWERDEGGLL